MQGETGTGRQGDTPPREVRFLFAFWVCHRISGSKLTKGVEYIYLVMHPFRRALRWHLAA